MLPDFQQIPQPALRLNQNPLRILDTHRLPAHLEWLSMKRTKIMSDAWVGPPMNRLQTLILDQTSSIDFILLATMAPHLRHLSAMDLHFLLDLSGLESLPLESLQLDGTLFQKLTNLPRHLQFLSAEACSLQLIQSRLPDTLRKCNLASNRLFDGGIPLKWGSCLQELDLSYNYLEKFPRALPSCLKVLKLQKNRITLVPKELPESLEILDLGHNRIREFPSWISGTKPLTYMNLDSNCLTHLPTPPSRWCNVLSMTHNWNTMQHIQVAYRVQKSWRLFRLRKTLRNLYRTSHFRDELLAVAMHPDRAGRFEDPSPEWLTESCQPGGLTESCQPGGLTESCQPGGLTESCHNHTHPRWD